MTTCNRNVILGIEFREIKGDEMIKRIRLSIRKLENELKNQQPYNSRKEQKEIEEILSQLDSLRDKLLDLLCEEADTEEDELGYPLI